VELLFAILLMELSVTVVGDLCTSPYHNLLPLKSNEDYKSGGFMYYQLVQAQWNYCIDTMWTCGNKHLAMFYNIIGQKRCYIVTESKWLDGLGYFEINNGRKLNSSSRSISLNRENRGNSMELY